MKAVPEGWHKEHMPLHTQCKLLIGLFGFIFREAFWDVAGLYKLTPDIDLR